MSDVMAAKCTCSGGCRVCTRENGEGKERKGGGEEMTREEKRE